MMGNENYVPRWRIFIPVFMQHRDTQHIRRLEGLVCFVAFLKSKISLNKLNCKEQTKQFV